jgi:hypothetical protein
MIVRIRAEYDPEAAVWVAKGDDIPLMTEAATIKALRAKLPGMIFDLVGEPATALVRYAAPADIGDRRGVRHIHGLTGGLMPAERIAASLCAMIWTAAWWLIDTWRSQASAALRFSSVQAVLRSIGSRIMSALSPSSIASGPSVDIRKRRPSERCSCRVPRLPSGSSVRYCQAPTFPGCIARARQLAHASVK